MLLAQRGAFLTKPYDAEVEYLKSTGTQWIDTDIKFTTDNARVKMTASVTYARDKALCGSQNHSTESSYGFVCYLYNNAMRVYMGASNTGGISALVDGNVHVVDLQANNGTLTKTIDGTTSTASYSGSIVSGEDFTILTSWKVVGSSITNRCVSGKIYAFQIWDNATLVRDLIPVRKGTVGYLYDRVSGALFGNAGTGDFVLGPDVMPATWVDGEYWDTMGVSTALTGASRCEDFIPVQPSSTVTFYLGARPGGTTLYMVQYNANKERINSTYNGNNVARTVTIPANCYYIRVSTETAKKNAAYIHDESNNRDLLRNGKISIPA